MCQASERPSPSHNMVLKSRELSICLSSSGRRRTFVFDVFSEVEIAKFGFSVNKIAHWGAG